jgi:hypothetical protein
MKHEPHANRVTFNQLSDADKRAILIHFLTNDLEAYGEWQIADLGNDEVEISFADLIEWTTTL